MWTEGVLSSIGKHQDCCRAGCRDWSARRRSSEVSPVIFAGSHVEKQSRTDAKQILKIDTGVSFAPTSTNKGSRSAIHVSDFIARSTHFAAFKTGDKGLSSANRSGPLSCSAKDLRGHALNT